MTGKQYLILRNTVRALRGSGVPLTDQQETDVQKYETAVREFEEQKVTQYESIIARGRTV